jgi:hypothetical protein
MDERGKDLVILIGGGGLLVARWLREWEQRQRARDHALVAALRALDEVETSGASVVSGRKRSHRVTVRCSFQYGFVWTMIDCELPDRPLDLVLWRQERALNKYWKREGRLVDIEVGDAAFDAEWIVEGAPADVVRRVLGPKVRDELMRLWPYDVAQPEPRTLRLRANHIREPAWIGDGIDLLISIAEAIEPAFEASDLEAAVHAQVYGAPYRGEIRPTDASAARTRELEHLEQVRRRRMKSIVSWWIITGAVVAAVVSLNWLLS